MFILSFIAINVSTLHGEFIDRQAGAFASFEGWVRDHNDGKSVTALEYEAFEPLCVKEAEKIFAEARQKFSIINVRCVHRTGKLNIGDMAVWVGVTAAHRDDAFQACRYIIDEVKHRLPIWKKEYYQSGDSGWVNCDACSGHQPTPQTGIEETDFYSRQLSLPDIGPEGQRKLRDAKVLVVGAGGLGSSCLMSLAQAGVGTIGICEFDVLDASNLHRQSLYSHIDVGKSKIELAASRIRSVNPFITVQTHPQELTVENVESIIRDYDLLIDGTDNFVAKFLLNDASVLFKKPLVQASIYQLEGQVRVYDPSFPSACLRCLWPKVPESGCVGNCAQAGVIGVIPGVIGNLQAWEAIKFILKLPDVLTQENLIFDFTSYSLLKIQARRSADCPLCGRSPSIHTIAAGNYSLEETDEAFLVYLPGMKKEDFSKYTFIDIRETVECVMNLAEIECVRLPLSQWQQSGFDFIGDRRYLVFCEKGVRSLNFTKELRKRGIANVHSVVHGVSAVKDFAQLQKI